MRQLIEDLSFGVSFCNTVAFIFTVLAQLGCSFQSASQIAHFTREGRFKVEST